MGSLLIRRNLDRHLLVQKTRIRRTATLKMTVINVTHI